MFLAAVRCARSVQMVSSLCRCDALYSGRNMTLVAVSSVSKMETEGSYETKFLPDQWA